MKTYMRTWEVECCLGQKRGKRMDILFIIFLYAFCFGAILSDVKANLFEDKRALLDFYSGINISHPLDWIDNFDMCNNWTGVTCDSQLSRVIALRLPGIGIRGSIPPNTLGRVSGLQILSLRSNDISGLFPSDFSGLGNLTSLYLQNNRLSGPLPVDFSVWKNLTFIDLSNNAFNGSIPPSFSNLTRLVSLNLANNSLSDKIPDLFIPSLQELNLANNDLIGSVPDSIKRFPSSAFSGNNLSPEVASPPAFPAQSPGSEPTRKNKKLGKSAILGIAIGCCVLVFVIIALLMTLCCSDKACDVRTSSSAKNEKRDISTRKNISGGQNKNNLVFFEGSHLAFDLDDLLRASAEVLGKGNFGLTYRAALEDATTLVVKRLKDVNVTKREFEQHMLIVGNIKHENVVPLRAYYHSKDEKLTVSDYFEMGSVSTMLHGKWGEDPTPLDWETRLRIAIGAARGIARTHNQNGGKLVHGNIKASNIFLNSRGYGCVSDVGLAIIMNPLPLSATRVAGHQAPELIDTRKASQASDVYSYGVFLLELLTGKPPTPNAAGEEVVHLVGWVNSVVREEWTAEVFDVELLKYNNIEEMVEMLQIGLSCTAKIPEQRPKILEVVEMIEAIALNNRQSPGSKSETSITTSTATPNGPDTAHSHLQSQIASSSSSVMR